MESTEKRHYAVIEKLQKQLTVSLNGTILAKTNNARILKEVGKTVYDPVFYIPKEDVLVDLKEDKQTSHCPIKGDASYWNVNKKVDASYFAWSYENPLPRARKIKAMVAFNADLVSFLIEPALA